MKISISLEEELVEWLNERATAADTSVSSVVADAVVALRQHEARLRVLEYLGGPASEQEVEEEKRRLLAAVGAPDATNSSKRPGAT